MDAAFTCDSLAMLTRERMKELSGERPAAEGRTAVGLADRPAPATPELTIVANDIGGVGGMERQLAELVIELARLGYKVTVIARTCELPDGTGAVFHRVRGPSRPFAIAYPWFVLIASVAVLRWRRGIVQATGAIVLTPVDVVAVHYCHRVATPTPSRSTRLFRAHIRLAGVLKRIGESVCFRISRAARFVCVSDGVAQEVREYHPGLASRTLTIHNGVDTETFAPGRHLELARAMRSELGIGEGRLVAAFVGGEWERKGLRLVIEALAYAREWDLVVAGGGDEKAYRELADALGVGGAVHWLGITREVPAVYELADAFVMASSYETFSLVTFEAAASGLPIVATPVSGVRELIEDGNNGYLIERDPRAIAERLRRLAAEPQLRIRLGRAARRSALAFTSERMVAGYHELYSRLAEPRSR
ncbi:MAG TPA: glycosyltransferase family 4 protein [Solirubrobacteraceae bacterium]|nr:glycosyltransferase family 4 protein [Solirubrobacteraceae bacterium]